MAGNDGTNNGVVDSSNGKFNVMSFDGVNDYIDTSLDPGTTFTISAWVNADAFDDTPNNIFSTLPTSTNRDGIDIGHHSTSGRRMVFFNSNSAVINEDEGTVTASTGVWYHVVCTYDGSNAKLYVNNTLVLSGTGTLSSNDTGLNIGRQYEDTSSKQRNGQIGLVRIYNRALSATEVQQLYYGKYLG